MKCNAPKQQGARKMNKLALIKNKKKVEHVKGLGHLLDSLEAQLNKTTDPAQRAELQTKIDETSDKIKTMSAEINAEVDT